MPGGGPLGMLVVVFNPPLTPRSPAPPPFDGRYDSWLMTEVEGLGPEPASFRQRRFELPPGAVELVLVRHGESEADVDGKPFPLEGGHRDPPPSASGPEQARPACPTRST